MAQAAIGAASGLVSNQTEGSTTAGNLLAYQDPGKTGAQANGNLDTASNDILASGANTYQNNLSGVQNGGQSNLFGQGGALSNALSTLNTQQNQGFNLTNADQTAYGQASTGIDNQFGAQQNSLAQSLSSRGMGSSGAAGAQFSGLQGSQNEQLAGLQTQIAQNRYNTNMQQIAQTQNFISSLGGMQNQAASQSQSGNANAISNQFNQAEGWNENAQGQSNNQMQQAQQSAHPSTWANTLNGAGAGAIAENAQNQSMASNAMSSVGSMASMAG